MATTTTIETTVTNRKLKTIHDYKKEPMDSYIDNAVKWVYTHPNKGHGDFTLYTIENEGEENEVQTPILFSDLTTQQKLDILGAADKATKMFYATSQLNSEKDESDKTENRIETNTELNIDAE